MNKVDCNKPENYQTRCGYEVVALYENSDDIFVVFKDEYGYSGECVSGLGLFLKGQCNHDLDLIPKPKTVLVVAWLKGSTLVSSVWRSEDLDYVSGNEKWAYLELQETGYYQFRIPSGVMKKMESIVNSNRTKLFFTGV